MDYESIHAAIDELDKLPLLHEEIIDELYRTTSLPHLHVLEGFLMANNKELKQT